MQTQTDADNARTALSNQFAEDPRRAPLEKETALHLDGDATHVEVTSFRKGVYAKLLARPAFEVKWLHVLDDNRREQAIGSVDEVADSSVTVIGVTGRFPVGGFTLGTPRNSNSHADIVTSV